MKRQEKSFFVTIEGGEGVGKSLFIQELSKALECLSVRHLLTREPGGTEVAERIRSLFNDPALKESLTMEAELFLVAAARAQHVTHKLRPTFEKGDSVICDRFTDSTIVYQGIIGGVPLPLIQRVNGLCTEGFKPDITFLLDCSPKISLARLDSRASQEDKARYDCKPFHFHELVREGFLSLAKQNRNRIKVLDASQEVSVLVKEAIATLREASFL